MATIILTESQIKEITERVLINQIYESFGDNQNIQNLLKKVKMYLAAGIAGTALLAAIDKLSISENEKEVLKDEIEMFDNSQSVFEKKVNAVKDCIAYYANLNGFSPNQVRMSPELMVRISDEYGFDLPLMLAQAKVESQFGTTPRALKTNSAFSIGLYDNGTNRVSYSNVNDSIEPYVKIMLKNYLSGKSIDEMLQPGNMVNQRGERYASNPNYEKDIRLTRNAIMKRHPDLI